jgi:8-oxo-dGTP pyrophosphatase MutT (NUDIX family)
MAPRKIYDVFQPGLVRGSERLPFDPEKAYAYVEHPTEGWRVYLRSAVFVHEAGAPFNCRRFVVVKKTGAAPTAPTWEPPKGQMEGKDMRSGKSIMALLEENVRRETEEEAHITQFTSLKHTGIIFQDTEEDFPANWYFQYHIFQGFCTPAAIQVGYDWFAWATAHPRAFARMRRDRREKDAIDWYSARRTPLNPRWCRGIAALYFRRACGSDSKE